jgi:hypothetical protein
VQFGCEKIDKEREKKKIRKRKKEEKEYKRVLQIFHHF